ncbi:alpha/beta hydrolase fold protein [Xylanimonas cellulosilytica DSM 15894]|uniref:Alpha/beta hydrolase fold protein n=1 Tax=Xylanimonas cellulosilytica (strain DSM 15894 / JCM 12276 / CECT 5975 / KCTC 9989 / LMG 20990 / NBRC 107835 / XIL07) TaxID=446471 RepID=D1BTH5_XYLCX|nr:alpha/beta fold hydrolase [Xylanimonas cellulosilytica]ACZ30954.1 alpha/beta hydrolase fold protein [Xylanimonas cellulosilytica DSM 15894]
MDIILIPGFWLDASAWDDVVPALEAAGHTAHPLTLPGLTRDADRSDIHLADHVAAVVAAIDAVPDARPVVLAGHSAGGGLAYAAAAQRIDRVARVIYVDSGPMAEGDAINADLDPAIVDFELPPWSGFGEDDDLVDLTDDLRDRFRARAIPQPGHTVREPHHYTGDADLRRTIPGTVIACEYPAQTLRQLMEQDHPYVREFSLLTDYEIVDLPTGHWPMFTKPAELAAAIAAAAR